MMMEILYDFTVCKEIVAQELGIFSSFGHAMTDDLWSHRNTFAFDESKTKNFSMPSIFAWTYPVVLKILNAVIERACRINSAKLSS